MNKIKAIMIVMIIFVVQGLYLIFPSQETDFSLAVKYFHQGEKLREELKLDESRAYFKKAINEDLNFTQAHRSYIDVSLQMGEEFRDQLVKEYEAYINIHQNNPVFYYALGRIYEDIQNREKVFQKALELDPSYPWGYIGMAYVYVMRKEIEKAIECYDKAIELEPNEVLFYTTLAGILYQRDSDRYKQVQEIVLKKFPDSSSAAMMVYQRASDIKDEAERIAAFEAYLKSYPDGPNSSIALSDVLDFYKKNDPNKAEKIARETLSLPISRVDKRSHRNAYLYLFQQAIELNSESGIKKITDEIYGSTNSDPSLYIQIAGQLQKNKRYEGAEKFYIKAIELITPENVYGSMAFGAHSEESLADYCKQVSNWYCTDFAKLYLEVNLPQKALEQLNKIEIKDPEPNYYLLLAKAYTQIGNKEKAYESLIKTLSLADNKEAREMLNQLSDQLNIKDSMEKIWEKRLGHARPAVEFTLPDMEGNPVSLKDFRGKVVLINFWFPACGPCREELPHIQKIHDKYKDQGLAVLLIQISQTQDIGKKFIEDHNYTMLSLFANAEWAKENYGVEAAPANFFIDREGRVIFQSSGYSPGSEKVIESQIKELLEFHKK